MRCKTAPRFKMIQSQMGQSVHLHFHSTFLKSLRVVKMMVRNRTIGMAPAKNCSLNEYSPYNIKKAIHIGESTHLQYITGLLICFQIYSRTDKGKLKKNKRKVNFDIMTLFYSVSFPIDSLTGIWAGSGSWKHLAVWLCWTQKGAKLDLHFFAHTPYNINYWNNWK